MKKFILFFVFASILSLTQTYAQSKIGLSGTIQNSQLGISLPVWLSEKWVLAPSFSFAYAEKIGSDLTISLQPRYYFKKDKLAPYAGIRFGAAINMPSSQVLYSEKSVDLMGGLSFGAEYFFVENFSVGIEAQGIFTKSDDHSNRFGNPGALNFNTATMISATIYF